MKKDWRGNEVKTTRAADLKPGDRIAGLWGREAEIEAVKIRGEEVHLTMKPYDCDRDWIYKLDDEVPERDPLKGYTGVYLGD